MYISIAKGILTGIILSLPFGPVGLYCIELTIIEGRWKGFVTALGMVSIDIFYSFISFLFLSKIESTILKYEHFLSLLIGLILMMIALRKLLSKTVIKDMKIEFKSIVQNYFIGVGFALANITSIIVITGVFTALRIYKDESPTQLYEILSGILIGGAGMWFFVTSSISHYRKKLEKRDLVVAIKVVNIVLLVFSILIIGKFFIKFY